MSKGKLPFKSFLRYAVYLLMAFIIGFPHFVLARFAIPGADDFSSANAVSVYRANHNVLVSAIAYVRDVYVTWQGNYTGELLMGLEPSVRESFTGIRIIMIAGVALFITAVILLVYTVLTKFLGVSSGKAFAAGLLAEFIVFNISLTGELFSWFTGAVIYLIPLIAFLFCLSFSIISYHDRKIVYAVLAGVLGVIGAGGSLEVVGFGCASYLVLVVIYILGIGVKNLKGSIKTVLFLVLPFVFTVAGALVNAAAPGNFARHDLMEENGALNVVPAFTSSWYNLMTHIGGLFTAYLLPLVLMLVFVICLSSVSKTVISGNVLAGGFAGALFVAVVTIFPVILGYSSYNIDAYLSASRIIYTFDFVIVMVLLILAAMTALYIKGLLKRNNIDVRQQLLSSLILLIAIALLFSGEAIKNYQNGMSYKIMDDLKNERMQIASAQMTGIYEKVASAEEGSDVVLTEPVLPGTVLYIPVYIDQPAYFANAEVADYYNVNSFILYWS